MHTDVSGTFNAGSGVDISIKQLLELISSTLHKTPHIMWEPSRSFDVPAIVLDCGKAKRLFSWTPRVALPKGLLEVADWLKGEVKLGPN